MGRTATAVLAAALLTLGGWSMSAGLGYERGKADAARALAPHGAVIYYKDGTCELYDQPGQTIRWRGSSAKTHVTFVIQPGP